MREGGFGGGGGEGGGCEGGVGEGGDDDGSEGGDMAVASCELGPNLPTFQRQRCRPRLRSGLLHQRFITTRSFSASWRSLACSAAHPCWPASRHPAMWRALALLACAATCADAFVAQPLARPATSQPRAASTMREILKLADKAAYDSLIENATRENRLVVIKFYASWVRANPPPPSPPLPTAP